MQRVSDGYTIIEVIIVLAVSGFLLVSAMTFLSGRESQVRFSQSMRNLQSKLQDWINDVPTGFAGGASGKTDLSTIRCMLAGDRPQINRVGGGPNRADCIFLGKAIQFTDASAPPSDGQASNIYAYSVFGRRALNEPSGGERLVANLIEANIVPAVGLGTVSGTMDLTETYTLGGGAKVLSITSQAVNAAGATVNGTSRLVGYYLSFNQLAANRNGSQDLRSYVYNLQANALPGNVDPAVDECISLKPGSGCQKTPVGLPNDAWPQGMREVAICLGNDSNSSTAILTLSSSNGLGASTKLEFTPCT